MFKELTSILCNLFQKIENEGTFPNSFYKGTFYSNTQTRQRVKLQIIKLMNRQKSLTKYNASEVRKKYIQSHQS